MKKPGGRKALNSQGYVIIGPLDVDPSDLPLFHALKNRSWTTLQHRWVMAKHIGRPLERWECVDHMDGDKTNNAVENLRLYVRGKQQPGSCPGHGTYYHEWQMAERRVRELEAQIAA